MQTGQAKQAHQLLLDVFNSDRTDARSRSG